MNLRTRLEKLAPCRPGAQDGFRDLAPISEKEVDAIAAAAKSDYERDMARQGRVFFGAARRV